MSRIRRHKATKTISHVEKKKGLSKSAILTIIIGGVMLLSTFGIIFSGYNSSTESVKYNGHTLKRTNAGWVTKINGQQVIFGYSPTELQNMNISKDAAEKLFNAKVLYITFNPNAKYVEKFELARFEMGQNLATIFNVYAMPGVTIQNSTYKQPVVTCENATMAVPVIYLAEANETKARVSGDCVILESDEYTIIALKDKILYAMLDMQDKEQV